MARQKKEFDKEIMYGKIMPSSLKNSLAINNNAENNTETVIECDETTAINQLDTETSSPTPATLFDQSSVNKPAQDIPLVVNIYEYLVTDKLEAAFSKFNCCKCDRCKKDVAALALNKLQPKYIVITQNELAQALKTHNKQDVSTAVIQAILQVKRDPRH